MPNTDNRLRPWANQLSHEFEESGETLWAETSDGLRLAIEHVTPTSSERPSAEPVMLLHGLAANRFTFHFPNRSLATFLAAQGFDCYVPELRGAGRSDSPPGSSWGLDDYTRLDLPAIVSAVLDASGKKSLSWVGHSLGGILLLLYAIENPADSPIVRGVTVGSAIDYRVGTSDFDKILLLRPLLDRLPKIPWGMVTHMAAPLIGRVRTPLESFNVWSSNIEAGILRRVFANGFEVISTPVLTDLATMYETGGIRDREGTIRYLEKIDSIDFPVLLLGGSRDVQCPAAAVQHTAGLLSQGDAALFGREHGHLDEYGHFDLLLGRRAMTEVWPHIVTALSADLSS